MNYRAILAANHSQHGTWCTCGELWSDCFVAQVLLPAMTTWREMQYATLFALADGA